jgi:hypothetical protein
MSDAGTPAAGLTGDPVGTASALDGAVPDRRAMPRRRVAPSTATSKVGSLDPTVVKVLTFLGFALPVGAYLAVLAHYQVNAVSGDQWSDVQTIAQSYRHFPDWSSLWSLHVDNRIFFPNLIVIGLAHTVSFNVEVEEYLSALMLFGAVTLIIWAHKRRSPQTPLLFYCPVVFVMLSFAQWQNTLWGFQMAWYLVLLAFALSVALLDWPKLSWPIFVAAVLVAVVASYSSLQGLLVWPVGLVLLYHRRRPRWAFTGWIVAALAATALYFGNYHVTGSSPPRYALEHPLLFVRFFLFSLGDTLGVPAKFVGLHGEANGGSGNAAVIVFGAVILVLTVLVVLKWGIRRDESSGAPIGVALIVFGLLFDALVTEGRLDLGFWGASQSRYTTYDLLVLVGIFLTALGGARSRVEAANAAAGSIPARGRVRTLVDRIDRRTVTLVALAAMVIQLALGVHYGLQGAREEHQDYVNSETLTRNIDHESDLTVYRLFFAETPQWIRQQAAFLRAHHLSEFG